MGTILITVYKGIAALSPFRAGKLLDLLQQIDPHITAVTAEFEHFVELEKPLTKNEALRLQNLLTYGQPFAAAPEGKLLLVVPRIGTISPWSSKASDIAKSCELRSVKRIERGTAYYIQSTQPIARDEISYLLFDRMTETILENEAQAEELFHAASPRPVAEISVLRGGEAALREANTFLGLALDAKEVSYLADVYTKLGRNPTDAELMMFAQVNSEHCRHKVFNASWVVDGKKQPKSLFKMIKNTYETGGQEVLSAYSDNAAILKGAVTKRFFSNPVSHEYQTREEPSHLVIKVETHNHPTSIAPYPGAATGVGGEIRDEGATGRGAKPKMGLAGFHVSNLRIPDHIQPWEKPYGKPNRITSAKDIMLAAPIGAAVFNNEFGRPNLSGYFRTYEQLSPAKEVRGYHKPIMLAGGLGAIRDQHITKRTMPAGAKLIVLGGPAMLIGLGGGAASSMQSGQSSEDLDLASVQRGNAEMQRRAQEVINSCWALGDQNPIITIHDVGAGGLSNALPELAHDSDLGARFELREVPNADLGMSPMEIWCNEAQERYVLGVAEKDLARFREFCEREHCPFAVVGETTKAQQLVLTDRHFQNTPIDLPMSVLFSEPPKMVREITRTQRQLPAFDTTKITLQDAVKRVLHLPAVGSKKFLITIGDRTVGGLTVRDQMVGPWQVPVSDVAVTAASFGSITGEAMSIGERTPVALIDAPASARMAIGEALTNIAAANIAKLNQVKLSANWMAAIGHGDEDQALFETVKAVGEVFCPALGLTIPVGKDSLSMRTKWQANGQEKSVMAPLSLIISAFAPVKDVAKTVTPQLVTDAATTLLYVDLGNGHNRLGASALAQVYNHIGNQAPDADPKLLKAFFAIIQQLLAQQKILAYHDRSDGGLFTTLLEMAFAGRTGLTLDLQTLPGSSPLEKLFNEELGAVIQVRTEDARQIEIQLRETLGDVVYAVGTPNKTKEVLVVDGAKEVYRNTRAQLEQWWASTSYHMQSLRDNSESAKEEFDLITDENDPGLSPKVTFDIPSRRRFASTPKVAILREQGVNGQVEMAAAFARAGFTAVDVHLQDIARGVHSLDSFVGLVACGGFSYGDVLGAGEGWAKSILHRPDLREQFKSFFARPDTFSLGVCNGCQMLAALKSLIPGANAWPTFLRNQSEQFEARLVSVKITDSPSIFFKDMTEACLPVPVAHGEGRAHFAGNDIPKDLVAAHYIDNRGNTTARYPYNPNGSPQGITALTTPDGRATIMMPHPERAFLTQQYSWHPADWDQDAPWFRMFLNAREWAKDT